MCIERYRKGIIDQQSRAGLRHGNSCFASVPFECYESGHLISNVVNEQRDTTIQRLILNLSTECHQVQPASELGQLFKGY